MPPMKPLKNVELCTSRSSRNSNKMLRLHEPCLWQRVDGVSWRNPKWVNGLLRKCAMPTGGVMSPKRLRASTIVVVLESLCTAQSMSLTTFSDNLFWGFSLMAYENWIICFFFHRTQRTEMKKKMVCACMCATLTSLQWHREINLNILCERAAIIIMIIIRYGELCTSVSLRNVCDRTKHTDRYFSVVNSFFFFFCMIFVVVVCSFHLDRAHWTPKCWPLNPLYVMLATWIK